MPYTSPADVINKLPHIVDGSSIEGFLFAGIEVGPISGYFSSLLSKWFDFLT